MVDKKEKHLEGNPYERENMHRIKGKLEKHPFLAKGKLSIA